MFTRLVLVSRQGAPEAARGMATLKEVSNRIKAVKNIAKITKSMKMVAAAKLRRAESVMHQSRAYAAGLDKFMKEQVKLAESKQSAEAASSTAKSEAGNTAVIAITTDRGLCGGVNSAVCKKVRAIAADIPTDKLAVFVVGDKGAPILRRTIAPSIVASFQEISKQRVSFATASAIADRVLKSGDFDRILLVSNQFVSKMSYDTKAKTILSLKQLQGNDIEHSSFEFDTDCLPSFYEMYVANSLFMALTENSAVELSSRTMAMDNASRNAGDMIERLSLFYNRSRQASITKELIEIISGAAAV